MTDRRRWLAVGLVIASAALLVLGIAAAIDTPVRGGSRVDVASTLGLVVPVAAFTIVGGLISLRRPGHLIGWLLATIGLLFAFVVACSAGSRWMLETRAFPQAAGEWISVGSSMWVVALGLIGTQLPLRLPDGKLPSRRWRWYSRVSLALIGVSLVGMTAQPGRAEGVPGTAGPLDATWLAPLASVFLLVILSFIGGLAALVVRYRRADVGDKLQLRWIAFGGVVFLATHFVTVPLPSILGLSEDSAEATAIYIVTQVAVAALPISIGYAVLRHRLYDIDAVISRTLVDGAQFGAERIECHLVAHAGCERLDRPLGVVLVPVEAAVHERLDARTSGPEEGGHRQRGCGYGQARVANEAVEEHLEQQHAAEVGRGERGCECGRLPKPCRPRPPRQPRIQRKERT